MNWVWIGLLIFFVAIPVTVITFIGGACLRSAYQSWRGSR